MEIFESIETHVLQLGLKAESLTKIVSLSEEIIGAIKKAIHEFKGIEKAACHYHLMTMIFPKIIQRERLFQEQDNIKMHFEIVTTMCAKALNTEFNTFFKAQSKGYTDLCENIDVLNDYLDVLTQSEKMHMDQFTKLVKISPEENAFAQLLLKNLSRKKKISKLKDFLKTYPNCKEARKQLSEILGNEIIQEEVFAKPKVRPKKRKEKEEIIIIDICIEKKCEEKDAPEELCCPITCGLMLDPVVCSDGFTYEREANEDWILNNPTSPLTRKPIWVVRPDEQKMQMIKLWKN
jgi:hypothetical protein